MLKDKLARGLIVVSCITSTLSFAIIQRAWLVPSS